MTAPEKKIWFSIAVVFAVCLTIYTLSYIVIQPWHILPDRAEDGIKNNFTYLYQCVYGKGFRFEGMNYPYGEHIVYADGLPLLSVSFALFFGNVSVGAALTALWWLIGISYILSITSIYRILTHFRVGPPVAIIFAGLISIFSPQIFRVGGHYALSFICVVPMLFYWTIKYHELSLKKYCVYISVFGIIMAFLHPYFAAMILIWVLVYSIGYPVFTKKKLVKKIKHVLPMLGSIIVVFASITIIMKITDPVTDRPVSPFGMLVYTTYKRDIVTSIYSPVWKYIHGHHILGGIFPHISEGGEGYSYLGLVIIAAVIFSLVAGVFYSFGKNKTGIIVSKDGFAPIWLFMGCCALLFSMGVPYVWHMEWLLDRFSFLRQFRTLGRFSWIFYYIITIYGVVVIHSLYARLIAQRRFLIGYAVLLLSIGVWSYEASGYTKYTRSVAAGGIAGYDSFVSGPKQNWVSYLQQHHLTGNDFQGILMLQFFHSGSDKLWIGEPAGRIIIAARAAFHLHLPIVDVMMSRSSLSQTGKQVKIAAGPYSGKPILNDIKSDKPFLLLKYDNDSLDMDQKYLLEATDYVGHYSQCNVYAFYPDRQRANDKKHADSINRILPFMKAADTCIMDRGEWYVNHLDGAAVKDIFFGKGALPVILGSDSIAAVIPIKPIADNQEYEFSCWFLLSDQDYKSPDVFLESMDSAGNIIETACMSTKNSVDNYSLWFRGSLYFHLKANCRAVRCRVENISGPAYKVMDEILLRPSDALIISKAADGSVLVNNHLFRNNRPQVSKMSSMNELSEQQVYEWLSEITDPEVPALNILDLGIVRRVVISGDSKEAAVTVVITPTYSGCPAMDVIAIGIRMALASRGIRHIIIEPQLSPAWTTDWMTEEGKTKLKAYGIAPPHRKAFEPLGLFEEDKINCPRCGSEETELVSQFGPTSCKALYKCLSCKEPFEHFKCH